jgi:formate dehydrogenase (coenzyme F420) beta subunit
MTSVEDQIRSSARKFLEENQVSCVIGYERDVRGRARPIFIEKAEDTERFIWGSDCNLNLVTYLHERKHAPGKDQPVPKTAIVARPCDIRAIQLLINEQQIKRENLKIIGLSCEGSEINGKPRIACQFCQERKPLIYDVLIEAEKPIDIPKEKDEYSEIKEMDDWSPEERLKFWTEEFDRCIRCYACRQACPGCYCFECVAEQVDPHWTSIALEIPEKMFFHVMRAYHLAGRCVGCDACEAACPMDIPLSKLNRKIAKEILDMFNYRTGDNPENPPPLVCFKPEERLKT